jgi:hypothetical protein
MTTKGQVTKDPAPGKGTAGSGGAGKVSGPGPATVPGGIVALNPSDGLFLRAEHLDVIQSYARELAMAVGVGSGTGVVYGFHVILDGSKPELEVSAGLAVSPTGRPLRSSRSAYVSLAPKDLPPIGDNGFWVIQVEHASWDDGRENVYGILCDEPCAGSESSIRPWTIEGVTVSLRADEIPGLRGVPRFRRRSWLASQYFERERRQSGPWVVPQNESGAVSSIVAQDWSKGPGQPATAAVPIGAIQLADDGTWILDIWTARRDIGGAPADNRWRARLAMRPWNVFLAQVLQFQDQLTSLMLAKRVVGTREVFDRRAKLVEEFLEDVEDKDTGKRKEVKALRAAYGEVEAPYAFSLEGQSLMERGFDQVPPAGYLACERQEATSERLEQLFGAHVDLEICHVRADYVAGAVEEAQHLDRIPLQPEIGDEAKVGVDILVPDISADLKGLYAGEYGWIAFVRRREARCESEAPGLDLVDVYVVEVLEAPVDKVREGQLPDSSKRVGSLSYPKDGWEYPGSAAALDVPIKEFISFSIIAVASADTRRPLAALRASLFGASLDGGGNPPQVLALAPAGVDREAIIVVLPSNLA